MVEFHMQTVFNVVVVAAVDRSITALFSALERTHCVYCRMCNRVHLHIVFVLLFVCRSVVCVFFRVCTSFDLLRMRYVL